MESLALSEIRREQWGTHQGEQEGENPVLSGEGATIPHLRTFEGSMQKAVKRRVKDSKSNRLEAFWFQEVIEITQ